MQSVSFQFAFIFPNHKHSVNACGHRERIRYGGFALVFQSVQWMRSYDHSLIALMCDDDDPCGFALHFDICVKCKTKNQQTNASLDIDVMFDTLQQFAAYESLAYFFFYFKIWIELLEWTSKPYTYIPINFWTACAIHAIVERFTKCWLSVRHISAPRFNLERKLYSTIPIWSDKLIQKKAPFQKPEPGCPSNSSVAETSQYVYEYIDFWTKKIKHIIELNEARMNFNPFDRSQSAVSGRIVLCVVLWMPPICFVYLPMKRMCLRG